MLPNVYQILRANSTVASTVGTRIYRHGSAPQDVAKPYITWSLSSGMPYDNVSAAPCADKDTVQIDCWSESDTGIETLAFAVRSALDSQVISNRMMLNTRETDTKLYRIALEADFIRPR
jgi:hypothetical protein